jgi:tyrosinase
VATGTPQPQALSTPVRYRRSAVRLTPGQLKTLREAFRKAQGIADDRGYGYFAGIHGLPMPIGCDAAHGSDYFLPWHRAYLYFFERALRDQEPNAMLTWWDWRTPRGDHGHVPKPFADKTAARKRNPLHSAKVDPVALQQGQQSGDTRPPRTERHPHRPGAPNLPSAHDVNEVLKIRGFSDFSAQLEGLHNDVHVWTGGHMEDIAFAAFDPIFWAHHTMVDRIWRLWQLRHPGARPPAAIMDEALPPFAMTVRQTLDPTALGYDYAVSSTSAAVA